MERFTRRFSNGFIDYSDYGYIHEGMNGDGAFQRLADYEDLGMSPKELRDMLDDYAHMVDRSQKLCYYEQAEKEGRLVIYPYKIGDTYYKIALGCNRESGTKCIDPLTPCEDCKYYGYYIKQGKIKEEDFSYLVLKELGETWFLSAEEALNALEKYGTKDTE